MSRRHAELHLVTRIRRPRDAATPRIGLAVERMSSSATSMAATAGIGALVGTAV